MSQQLVEHARQADASPTDRAYLEGDVIAMIIAGSDTIASAMVYALYHLAIEPTYQSAILEEIEAANWKGPTDMQTLQNLPLLDGVVKETLRLHPPVVTGGPRDTGPDGLLIAGRFIPPYTTVITPRYTIARCKCEKYFHTFPTSRSYFSATDRPARAVSTSFSNPDAFLPLRWTSGGQMEAHDTRAFAPFGAGKYACIGRALAMRQLKLTLVRLISRYDIRLAPGEQGTEVVTNMRDQFTAVPGKLRLCFFRKGSDKEMGDHVQVSG